MDTMQVNRIYKRKVFSRPVRFELSAMGQGARKNILKSGKAMNISSGGMGLYTAIALKRGEVLKLYLPAITRSAVLPVFSEVVWVRQAGAHVEAGLRFLG